MPSESVVGCYETVVYNYLCSLKKGVFFTLYITFCLTTQMKNYKEMGLVMAVKAEAIPKFRKKLEALVSE
jgi:hypothetical protein